MLLRELSVSDFEFALFLACSKRQPWRYEHIGDSLVLFVDRVGKFLGYAQYDNARCERRLLIPRGPV